MKRFIITALLALVSYSAFAQAKVDTLYYSRDGKAATVKAFADYYRVALYSEDPAVPNKYRDFHINGRLMSEGEFISIDANDDRNTQFIGTITVYNNEGNISAKRSYENGLLHGISEEYYSDGTIIQEIYEAGKPAQDYYVKSDFDGNMVKIRYADNSIVWESPSVEEMTSQEHEGNTWYYYNKNGVTVALYATTIRDYGKYHVLNLTIANHSLVPIDFEPSCNITASSVNKKNGEETVLKVYSCDEYIKKVDNRNAIGAALMSVSDIITIVDAGTSKQTSVSVNNKGERTVTHTKTYSPFNEFLAFELSMMEAREYNKNAIEGREVRRVGYFKQSTINPGESVSGYAHVERVKGNDITINIDIDGAIFSYTWTYKK